VKIDTVLTKRELHVLALNVGITLHNYAGGLPVRDSSRVLRHYCQLAPCYDSMTYRKVNDEGRPVFGVTDEGRYVFLAALFTIDPATYVEAREHIYAGIGEFNSAHPDMPDELRDAAISAAGKTMMSNIITVKNP
jgi:hypothetical protein